MGLKKGSPGTPRKLYDNSLEVRLFFPRSTCFSIKINWKLLFLVTFYRRSHGRPFCIFPCSFAKSCHRYICLSNLCEIDRSICVRFPRNYRGFCWPEKHWRGLLGLKTGQSGIYFKMRLKGIKYKNKAYYWKCVIRNSPWKTSFGVRVKLYLQCFHPIFDDFHPSQPQNSTLKTKPKKSKDRFLTSCSNVLS